MARLAERLLVQAHQLTSEIDELTAELSARLQVLALTLATRSHARELTGASGDDARRNWLWRTLRDRQRGVSSLV